MREFRFPLAHAALPLLLIPQVVQASDPGAFIPFLVAGCALAGGVVAGFEWMIVTALMNRGGKASPGDPAAPIKSRCGCVLGIALWAANGIIAWFVLVSLGW